MLIPGARFDYYKMDPDENDALYLDDVPDGIVSRVFSEENLSPRLGMIYELNENMNLYGQYSSGFKVPPYDLAYMYMEMFFVF